MFWKAIRWGGSAVIVALVLAAALLRPDEAASAAPDGASAPAHPADDAVEPAKNFNL